MTAWRSAAAAAAVLVVCATADAQAACQKLGFSVNDYGKEGPANDAKKLLDKYIAEWTANNGIKNYRTGKKTVTCELFIDLGFFDEYTCKAVATFCCDGPPVKTN
jgi:hypothetical protein